MLPRTLEMSQSPKVDEYQSTRSSPAGLLARLYIALPASVICTRCQVQAENHSTSHAHHSELAAGGKCGQYARLRTIVAGCQLESAINATCQLVCLRLHCKDRVRGNTCPEM